MMKNLLFLMAAAARLGGGNALSEPVLPRRLAPPCGASCMASKTQFSPKMLPRSQSAHEQHLQSAHEQQMMRRKQQSIPRTQGGRLKQGAPMTGGPHLKQGAPMIEHGIPDHPGPTRYTRDAGTTPDDAMYRKFVADERKALRKSEINDELKLKYVNEAKSNYNTERAHFMEADEGYHAAVEKYNGAQETHDRLIIASFKKYKESLQGVTAAKNDVERSFSQWKEAAGHARRAAENVDMFAAYPMERLDAVHTRKGGKYMYSKTTWAELNAPKLDRAKADASRKFRRRH